MSSWKIKLISAVVMAVLVIIWILQNGGSVQTKFLFLTVTMPLPALLAMTFLAGAVAGAFLTLGLSNKWNRNNR